MKLFSLPAAIKYIWKCQKRWGRPKHTDILIFDREGASDFFEYFNKYSFSILECRGESINVLALLYALVKHKLKVNIETYAESYIKLARPLVVVTFIDNTKTFYKLKKYHAHVKFISVQNGYRDRCLFEVLLKDNYEENDLSADAVFCFGPAIGLLYEGALKTSAIPHGSFKNNKVAKSNKSISAGEVVFLSQFRPPVWNNGLPTMPVGERNILWDDFYSTESLILPALHDFCNRNGLVLKVCGTSFNEDGAEFDFFSRILGDGDWEYWLKSGNLDNYNKIDQASVVVFIDSTLGYEALGRGLKCAAFPLRGDILQTEDRGFGWPAELPRSGPFWTSQANAIEIERLMNFVSTVCDDDWLEVSTPVVEQLMRFDSGNSRFIELIESYGVKSKE